MSLLANQSGVRPGEYFWSSAVDIGQDGFEYIGGVIGVSGSSAFGNPMTVASFGFTPVKRGIIVVFGTADVSTLPGVAPENMTGNIYIEQIGTGTQTPMAGSAVSIPANQPKNIALSGGIAVEAGATYSIIFQLTSPANASFARGNLACFFFE
jgi:hypothetical protein